MELNPQENRTKFFLIKAANRSYNFNEMDGYIFHPWTVKNGLPNVAGK